MRVRKRSSLFLLELIIAILLFALASAVCVRVFVESRVKTADSLNLTMAVQKNQNAAELLRTGGVQELAAYYPDCVQTEDGVLVFFDKDWSPCTQELAAFTQYADFSEQDYLLTAQLAVFTVKEAAQNSSSLYELMVDVYRPGQGG